MKRIKLVAVCFGIALTVVSARVFYVGVIKQGDYTESVMSQRVESVKFLSPRGIIYDRNMIKFTDAKMKLVIKSGKPYYVGNRTGNMLSHVIGYISGDGKGCALTMRAPNPQRLKAAWNQPHLSTSRDCTTRN